MRLIAEALASFWTARRLGRPGLSRVRFEALQAKALRRWLDRDVPQVAAFGRAPARLADLPVMDKAGLMAGFDGYNRPGIPAETVAKALKSDCRVGGYTVGASTGTSGNRGYFVISEAERYRWLGAILAKALADMLWQRQRVAILLPQDTRLYGSARSIPRLELRFFPLAEGAARWGPAVQAFDPTVIVAPPKVLRHLAESDPRPRPRRIFSAAETLDPVDRTAIEAGFSLPLDQIYMATEGLLGVTCRHGTLHLAEDSVHFEFEPVGEGLVSPLITSFRRKEQIMARYRMNDLLRLADAPCPCGSPLRAVAEVVGRMDDCFHLAGPEGSVMVTPDILRNAVLDADRRIIDYRLRQVRPDGVELLLPDDLPPGTVEAARSAVMAVITRTGARAEVTLRQEALVADFNRKLRRVECCLPRKATP
jgi:putative adenylate-forming enzyme